MRQLSIRDQMTQKLTTIGNRTAFKHEQSPHRIVSYKRPRNDKCKTIQTRRLTIYVQKMNDKQICNTSTNRLLTWDRHMYTKYGEIKNVSGKPPNLGQWCNSTT